MLLGATVTVLLARGAFGDHQRHARTCSAERSNPAAIEQRMRAARRLRRAPVGSRIPHSKHGMGIKRVTLCRQAWSGVACSAGQPVPLQQMVFALDANDGLAYVCRACSCMPHVHLHGHVRHPWVFQAALAPATLVHGGEGRHSRQVYCPNRQSGPDDCRHAFLCELIPEVVGHERCECASSPRAMRALAGLDCLCVECMLGSHLPAARIFNLQHCMTLLSLHTGMAE